MSPDNILYHFYYAEASRHLMRYSRAARHYRICLEVGMRRNPPQRLRGIRRKLKSVQEKRGWFSRLLMRFFPTEDVPPLTDEEQMRLALETTFAKNEKRARVAGRPERKLLG